MTEFRVFGPTSLRGAEGNELLSVLSRPKLLSFLVVLASWPGGGFIRRETLLGLFWSDSDPPRARASLRQFIYRIRSSLGADAIESRGEEEIRLNPSSVWCDVRAFEDALARGAREEALLHYRGVMMEGFYPTGAPELERWLDQRRVDLQRTAAESARTLAEELSQGGNLAGAGHWARRAAELCGCDEAAVRECIALLARLGDAGGALEVFQSLERRLKEELDLTPSPSTRELALEIRGEAGEEKKIPPDLPATAAASSGSREGMPAPLPPLPTAVQRDGAAPGEAVSTGRNTRGSGLGSRQGWIWLIPALLLITIPLVGGYLSLGMLSAGDEGGVALEREREARALPATVLAALPLATPGSEEEVRGLAAGIYQGMVDHLSRIPGLTLISNRTMRRYGETTLSPGELGGELGAGSILLGEIRWDDPDPRITVTLMDAPSGVTLWSEVYHRPIGDIPGIQREIAQQIAQVLGASAARGGVERLDEGTPRSLDAYRLYLRSRGMAGSASRLPDLMVEEQLLRQALAMDPEFAAAWSALAWNFARRVSDLGRSESWSDSAMVAAQTSLSLDPGSGEAHLVMGSVYVSRGFLDRGEESLLRALELDPNLAVAHFLLGRAYLIRGRFDEAILALRRALLRDPASPSIQSYIGLAFSFLGEMDRAQYWIQREIQALESGSSHRARMEAVSHLWRGDLESAFRAGLKMVDAAPEEPRTRAYLADLALQSDRCGPAVDHARRAMAMASDPQGVRYAFYASTILGVALIQCGKPREGESELERSKEELLAQVEAGSQDPFIYAELAAVYEALGDRETAVIWIRKAYQQGFRQLRMLDTHVLFKTLRQDPEVQVLMIRIREELDRMSGTVTGVLGLSPGPADSAALALRR